MNKIKKTLIKSEIETNNNTMFYTFYQNNSGGYFYSNNDVAQWVIVEAQSKAHANTLMLDIAENYSDYCDCCGERWDLCDDYDNEAFKAPAIDNKPIEEYMAKEKFWLDECRAVVYYLNGDREIYEIEVE